MTKEDARIQFRHPLSGIRKTICTGLADKREIVIFKAMIATLVEAIRHGQEPPAATRAWCEKLNPKLRDKIAKVDLIHFAASTPVTLTAFIDAFIADKNPNPASLIKFKATQARVIEHFGAHKNLRSLNKGDALRFSAWLVTGTGNAENTARKHRARFSQMLAWGVDNKVLIENPMRDKRIKTIVTPASDDRRYCVTQEDSLAILAECKKLPTLEFAAYFTLLRWGGLRAAEPFEMRWGHVDFATKRFTVHAPKTKHHQGKDKRIVPMYGDSPIEGLLTTLYAQAGSPGDQELLFPGMMIKVSDRARTNAASNKLKRLCKAAAVSTYPRMLQNLRDTASNEISREYGPDAESAWIGHSKKVAALNYTRVKESEFQAAIQGKSGSENRVTEKTKSVTDRVTNDENQLKIPP